MLEIGRSAWMNRAPPAESQVPIVPRTRSPKKGDVK